MASTSFCCIDACAVSVKDLLKTLGLLDGGGEDWEVWSVPPLSLVGVLDESAESDEAAPADTECDGLAPGAAACSADRRGEGEAFAVEAEATGPAIWSGLADLGIKSLSNTFSPETSAGPVRGPWGTAGSGFGRLPAPTMFALARSSSMLWASWSPETRAWALAIAALLALAAAQPMRSRMNSIERLRTLWRLCMSSSDWLAKEKECSDSEGKRERSSVKVGEAGPGNSEALLPCGCGSIRVIMEAERGRLTDGLREEGFEADGRVGARTG